MILGHQRGCRLWRCCIFGIGWDFIGDSNIDFSLPHYVVYLTVAWLIESFVVCPCTIETITWTHQGCLINGSLIIVLDVWAAIWMAIKYMYIDQVHVNVKGMIVPNWGLFSCLDHCVVCNLSCRKGMSD